MTLILHAGYWITGIAILALMISVVAWLQHMDMNARWPVIKWPAWLRKVGGWMAAGIAALALIAALVVLPYFVGEGFWGWVL